MMIRTGAAELVSHIMPVWRPNPAWLLEAVSSVLAQRGCELELIVVDDGCDQAAAPLLATVRDRRLRLLRIDHGGESAARNVGINAAQGAWLRFVDADDVLPPGSTHHLMGFMDADRQIAYGSTLVCDEALRPRRVIESTLQGNAVVECLLGRFHTRHPSMLFPRRVVDAAGLWDTTFHLGEDWDFTLRALEHARVCGDRQVVMLYRRHRGSLSRAADLNAGEDARRRIISRYFLRHREQAGTELERRAWAALHLDSARACWNAGQHSRAFTRLARFLRETPLAGSGQLARLVGGRVRRRMSPHTGATSHS